MHKSAEPPAPPPLDPSSFEAKMLDPRNVYRAKVFADIAKLGLGAFGVGAAIRGAHGLADTLGGAVGGPPKVPLARQVVTVPIPRRRRRTDLVEEPLDELSKEALLWSSKWWPQPAPLPTAPPPTWGTNVAGKALDAVGGLKSLDASNWNEAKDWLWTHDAKSPADMTWAIPAGVGLVGAGLYGGHKLTDMILDQARGRETESELEEAKKRYERALLRGGGGVKSSAVDPYAGLDRVFDRCGPAAEKQATIGPQLLGGYLTTAAALAGLSGLAAYKYVRNQSDDKAVAEAMRRRREHLFATGMPTLVAMPNEFDPDAPPPEPPRRLAEFGARLGRGAAAGGRAVGRGATAFRGHVGRGVSALRDRFGREDDEPKEAAAGMGLSRGADYVLGNLAARNKQLREQQMALFGIKKPEPPKPAAGPPPPPALPSIVNARSQPARA